MHRKGSLFFPGQNLWVLVEDVYAGLVALGLGVGGHGLEVGDVRVGCICLEEVTFERLVGWRLLLELRLLLML